MKAIKVTLVTGMAALFLALAPVGVSSVDAAPPAHVCVKKADKAANHHNAKARDAAARYVARHC